MGLHITDWFIGDSRAIHLKDTRGRVLRPSQKPKHAPHGTPHLDDSPEPAIAKRPYVTPETTSYEGLSIYSGAGDDAALDTHIKRTTG